MIRARDVIESIAYKKQYPSDKEPYMFSLNPSTWAQALRDLKGYTRTSWFRDEPILRFVYNLKNQYLSVWCAYMAIHGAYMETGTRYLMGAVDIGKKTFNIRGIRISSDRDVLAARQTYGYNLSDEEWEGTVKRLRTFFYGLEEGYVWEVKKKPWDKG